jgi:hypothetical protein
LWFLADGLLGFALKRFSTPAVEGFSLSLGRVPEPLGFLPSETSTYQRSGALVYLGFLGGSG